MSTDAIVILKDDHKRIKALFREFQNAGENATKRKGRIVGKIIEELTVHTYIETEGMYPEVRKLLPFVLLGFDTDNDSVFMNETVRDYCLDQAIVFTRSRPYRKNDQAFVEQKNEAIVRHAVGYHRFEGILAAAALARLYASLRLFVNFFQPSFKLAEKERLGALVRKRYHPPATPFQRLLEDPRVPAEAKAHLQDVFLSLDPVHLLQQIREGQARLVELAV